MCEFSLDSVNFQKIYKHYQLLINEEINSYETRLKTLVFPVIPITILRALCRNVNYFFSREPILLHINSDVVIIGDLHGHILDLFRILKKYGMPPATKYLILGDIVDRGEFSVETITLLFLLKALFPQSIYIIRGNHEFPEMYHLSGFYSELQGLYPGDQILDREFQTTFSNMPIAALIFDKILCIHGGIGPNVNDLQHIGRVMRPVLDYNNEPICSVVWSDPISDKNGFSPSSRGLGYFFGKDVFMNFIQKNNLEIVVRGHQCVDGGIAMEFNKRLITVFSASYYCGSMPNKAGALAILNNGNKKEATVFQPIRYVRREAAVFIRSENETVFSLPKEELEKAFLKNSLPNISNHGLRSVSSCKFTNDSDNQTKKKRRGSLIDDLEPHPRRDIKKRGWKSQSQCLMYIPPSIDNYKIGKRDKTIRKKGGRRLSLQ